MRHQRDQERFELGQQLRLVDRPGRNPERHGHGAQQVFRVQLSRYQLRGDELVGVDLFEEAPHQRRLPRSDFPGDDDEAFTLVDAVLQVGEGALVSPAAVEKSGIRIKLEGLPTEPEEGFVHVAA